MTMELLKSFIVGGLILAIFCTIILLILSIINASEDYYDDIDTYDEWEYDEHTTYSNINDNHKT